MAYMQPLLELNSTQVLFCWLTVMPIDIYERSMLVCKNSTSTKQECLQQAQTKQAGQDMPAGQADGPGEEMCLL